MRQSPAPLRRNVLQPDRRAAALAEFGVILGAWSVVFFATFDFGISTFRSNLVTHLARQAVRMAMVRGADAGPELPVWGPEAITVKLTDDNDVATTIKEAAGGILTSGFEILLEWPDGNNEPESRIRATVTSTHESILAGFIGRGKIPVRSVSTMRIAH